MANSAGSIAKFFVKWLVIPVGLAAIGFFVVGPRIGSPPEAVEPAPANLDNLPPDTKENPTRIAEPEVEVTARPAGRTRSPRRRSSRPAAAPAEAAPRREEVPPPVTTEPPVVEPPAADPPTR